MQRQAVELAKVQQEKIAHWEIIVKIGFKVES